MSHLPNTFRRIAQGYLLFTSFLLAGQLQAQNVGINTESPIAGLHMINNNGMILSGEHGQGLFPPGGYQTAMMWSPKTGSFRVGRITDADGGAYENWWQGFNTGDYSFASGVNPLASGYASVAFGDRNQSTGLAAFAAGGLSNVASGHWSFVTGYQNQSPSFAEFVIGANATLYTATNPAAFNPVDRLFVIGNGENNNNRHNAMTVLKNGNIGIGTDQPTAMLEVDGLTSTEKAVVTDSLQSLHFKMTHGAAANKLMQSDALGNAQWVDPAFVFNGVWDSSNNNIYNTNSANVGIGTSNPGEKLQVNGNLKINDGRIIFFNDGGATLVGKDAGLNEVMATGNISTFIGYHTGKMNTTGGENTAVGAFAFQHNTTGAYNAVLGNGALGSNINGSYNSSVGYSALTTLTTGDGNVAMGYYALSNSNGSSNVGIGSETGNNNTSGHQNVYVGNQAGFNNLGSGNIFLGNQAGFQETSSSKLYIDNSSTTTPLIYGDFANNKIIINDSLESKYFQMTNGASTGNILVSDATGHGSWSPPNAVFSDDWNSNAGHIYNANTLNVGIGVSAPTEQLHVNGNMRLNAGRLKITGTGRSVFIGQDAGMADDLSDNNSVFIGYEAGKSNTNGSNNIAIGTSALKEAQQASYNIAIGENVLGSALMTGNVNIGIGNFCLQNNSSGHDNIGIGQNTLSINQSGNYNVGIGNYAMDANTEGWYNVAFGSEALGNNVTGYRNTAIGHYSLHLGGGDDNTAIGYEAGYQTTGSGSVFIGEQAGRNESGSNKLYIDNSSTPTPLIYGDFSQNKLTINDSLQTKYLSVSEGAASGKVLQSNASGLGIWVEPYTLFEDVDNVNIFLGQGVGQSVTSATDNTIIGSFAGEDLTTGYENTGYGKWTLANTTTAAFNTAIGHNTLNVNVTGINNTALGWSALAGATGSSNVAVGSAAGSENNAGSQNLYLGTESGMNNTGSGNVFIGHQAGKNVSGSNKLNIDNSDTATPLIQGDFTANEVTINDSLTVGKELGVGTATPASTFEVNGSVAAKFKTPLVAGTSHPDGTGMVWRYSSGTGTITLPGASTCPNRMYVIINQTGTSRTISTYRDLTTTNQTTLGSSVALWLMSDGTEWWQIK